MATLAQEAPSLARDRAFEALYRQYVKDVYHYALALLRNPADAEDVTQTTFMNAYRAFKRGEEPIKPQNWLIKIAHNVARSRYATASRRVKEVPLDQHVEQLSLPQDERPDVEAVLTALARLPLNQRAALVLRELEGRTYAEIADTLAVSVPAVETLIFRARRSLRMKASAIRALGVVPVPSSLAQVLESGTGVAAGGFLGSSLLLKALVAVIAGGAVTGLVGETRSKGAPVAAAGPQLTATTAGAASTTQAPKHRGVSFTSAPRRKAVDPSVRPDGARAGDKVIASASTPTTASAPTMSSSASPTSLSTATSPVSAAVSTVASTAPSLTVSTPELPVTTTVSVPPPPPLPPLP